MSAWRSWFVGVLIVAALVMVVMHLSELHRFAVLIDKAEPGWLIAAFMLQLSTYVSLAMGWKAVLVKSDGQRHLLPPLMRIALCKLFADQTLPTAGLSGNVVLVDQLVGIGASRGTAVATLLLSMLGFYASYLVFALTALLLL